MSNLHSRSGASGRSLPLTAGQPLLLSLELARGDSLYRRGDQAGAVYRVEAGLLKLFVNTPAGRERITALAGPGDLIGSADPGSSHCTENAAALSSSVRVSVLGPGLQLNPELQLEALSWQLQQLRDSLEDGELPVPARLARTFVRLAERFGQRQASGLVRLTLPLTHEDLAAIIGAARETTSTVLAGMRSAGVLSGTRGSYSLDPETMRDYAAQNSIT